MGTNYYWRTNICCCCNRYNEYHLGKSSGGWTFMFQAYNAYDPQDYGMSEEYWPFQTKIKSRRGWVRMLERNGGEIWDQYGSRVPDPVQWLKDLTAPGAEQLASERQMETVNGQFYFKDLRRGREKFRDEEKFRMSLAVFT